MSEQAPEPVGPSLHFRATVRLHCCKARVSPCRQVATTKIRKPTDVLTGSVKRPGILPQNPAVSRQTSTCLFQRDTGCREHTPAAPGKQHGARLQSPCFVLSPRLLHSPFKPKILAMSICCWVWPWTSAFSLQTQRQSTVSACEPPYSQLSCSLLGACSMPRNISKSPQGRRKQTCLCLLVLSSPHLPGQQQTRQKRGLNTHVLWEQD